jgi:hypothetical protein
LADHEIPVEKLYVTFVTGDGKKRSMRYSVYQEFREYIELIFAHVQTVEAVPVDAIGALPRSIRMSTMVSKSFAVPLTKSPTASSPSHSGAKFSLVM